MRIALCVAWSVAGALCLGAERADGQAVSRNVLTLAAARDSALRHSPEVAAVRHAVAAAVGRERQAGAWLNPTLSYRRERTSLDGAANSEDVVTLDQPVGIGGQRGARQEAARLTRSAAEAQLIATSARVDFETIRSYAAAVAGQRRAALADSAAESFAHAVRLSEERLAAGDISGYDHRRLQLESARYAVLGVEALAARDSALGVLAFLTGMAQLPDSLEPSDAITPAPLALSADSLVALALTGRAELQAGFLSAQAADAEADATAAARIPTPTFSLGYKHERLADNTSPAGYVAGVSLPLPLWDRGGGAVDAARSEAARLDAEVTLLERQTERAVRSAFAAHQALATQVQLVRAQLGEGAETARLAASSAYAEGEISLLQWLDTVRAYQEAESSYIALWSESIIRRAALQRLTGAILF